jgi:hypothetical protein
VLGRFTREGEGTEGVAAHFRLTASRVADPAAEALVEALVESSAICCDAGLEAVTVVADVVADAQL